MSVQSALERFAKNRDLHVEDLKKLVRIPSVSADGFDPAEVKRSADAVAVLLRERGLHRLPVTHDGKLVGIVTGSDILLALLGQLEGTHTDQRAAELQPSAEELIAAGAGDLR